MLLVVCRPLPPNQLIPIEKPLPEGMLVIHLVGGAGHLIHAMEFTLSVFFSFSNAMQCCPSVMLCRLFSVTNVSESQV
jgi:hypothetical protein